MTATPRVVNLIAKEICYYHSLWAARVRSGNGPERVENRRQRSGERAKSAAQNPLHHKNH